MHAADTAVRPGALWGYVAIWILPCSLPYNKASVVASVRHLNPTPATWSAAFSITIFLSMSRQAG